MLLKIHNFACLKNIEIEIIGFTIIIGEQASGKSVTSKVYFFLREIVSSELSASIIEGTGFRGFQVGIKKQFSSIFPEYSWKESKFEISLSDSWHDDMIVIKNCPDAKGLKFYFSDRFKNNYRKISQSFKAFNAEIEKNRAESLTPAMHGYEMSGYRLFMEAIHQTQTYDTLERVVYIPSGRSFFSTLKDNVFGFLSENIGIDPFLKSFGKNYELAKRPSPIREKRHKEILAKFDKVSASILKGRFMSQKKEDWIVSDNSRIAVSSASSGQQEALPLLLVLRDLISEPPSSFRGRSVVIEEPEAHLFPVSQKAIVELIFLTKEHCREAKLLITTHSPYVLSCVNNGILNHQKNVRVNAYFLSNGVSTPILDPETQLIDGEELDKISGDIADEFYIAMESITK